MPTDRSAENQIVEGGNAIQFVGRHLEDFGHLAQILVRYPAVRSLHDLQGLDAAPRFSS